MDGDINLRNSCGKTALYLAVLRNHLNVVKVLVEHGANVGIKEENGWSPLHVASAKGYYSIMKYLLQKGGSIFHSVTFWHVLSKWLAKLVRQNPYINSKLFPPFKVP